jgi:hypothetical protein
VAALTPDAMSPALQADLETIAVGPFAQTRLALVRFDQNPPAVALWKPDDPVLIASMGKLAILYAAFQLLEDVRTIARTFPTTTAASEVNAELRNAWAAAGAARLATIANSPHIARLEHIFDFRPLEGVPRRPGDIHFLGMRRCGISDIRQDFPVDSETVNLARRLEGLPHGLNSASNVRTIAGLSFAERLWMTTVWSDNIAASSCIWDVGLGYIQALMYDSGLFSDDRSGLWLSRTFNESMPQNHGTRLGVSPSLFSPPVTLKKQNGTARALAALLVAIETDALISPEAVADMKRLLRPLDRITVEGVSPDPHFGIAGPIETVFSPAVFRHDVLSKAGLYTQKRDDAEGVLPFATFCDWSSLDLETSTGRSKLGVIILGATSALEDGTARENAVRKMLSDVAVAIAARLGV